MNDVVGWLVVGKRWRDVIKQFVSTSEILRFPSSSIKTAEAEVHPPCHNDDNCKPMQSFYRR